MVNFIPNPIIGPDKEQPITQAPDGTDDRTAPTGNYDQVAKQVDKDAKQDNTSDNENAPSGKDTKSTTPDTVKEEAADTPILVNFFNLPKGKTNVKMAPLTTPFANVLEDASEVTTPLPEDPTTSTDDDAKASKEKTAPKNIAKSIFTPQNAVGPVANTKKDKASPFEAVEQPDLASVSQAAYVPVAPVTTVTSAAPITPPPQAQDIQDVIDQITNAVYSLEDSGKTETMVPLQGAFEGSQLTITQFSTAPGQMNITIDNLTNAGQLVIEANKALIMNKLENDLDIRVPIFIASTTLEGPRIETAKADVQQGRGSGTSGQQAKQENPQQRG